MNELKGPSCSLNTRYDDGSLFSGSHINFLEASCFLDINDLKRRALKVSTRFSIKDATREFHYCRDIYFTCYEHKFMRKTCRWYYFLDNGQLDGYLTGKQSKIY